MEDTVGLQTPGRADGDFVDGLCVGDAIRFFLDVKRAGGRSEMTLSEYRKKRDLFQRWDAARLDGAAAVDAPVSWLGPDEVEGYVVYMRGRGLSVASVKNHLSVIRSFFDTLSRRLDLPDPTRRLDEVRFHQKAPKRTFLTRREADVLLGAMEKAAADHEGGDAAGGGTAGVRSARRREAVRAIAARDHAAFSTMIYAGLRIEETTALAVDDLSFARGSEEVRVARGKGNKERVVPMGPRLRRSLRRYLRTREVLVPAGDPASGSPLPHLFITEKGSRVTEGTLRRRLYGWVRQARLKKAEVKPHDLRRTFGTWYLQENPGQVIELAELMGHSNLSQVRKYALSDAERARAGVAKL